jgi:hypothetical protein
MRVLTCLVFATLVSSCATDRNRLSAVEQIKAQDAVIAELIRINAKKVPIPSQPPECRGPVRSGATEADRVDVALIKQDRALGKANATLAACAALYDRIKKGSR